MSEGAHNGSLSERIKRGGCFVKDQNRRILSERRRRITWKIIEKQTFRIALAMATLCFSPPDSLRPLSPTYSSLSSGVSANLIPPVCHNFSASQVSNHAALQAWQPLSHPLPLLIGHHIQCYAWRWAAQLNEIQAKQVMPYCVMEEHRVLWNNRNTLSKTV